MARQRPVAGLILVAGLAGLLLPSQIWGQGVDPGPPPLVYPRRETLLDIAAQAGSFNTLISAIRAAGLEDNLSHPGPYTLFAPTDKAFSALPPGMLDDLMRPENRNKLRKIINYHVLLGRLTTRQIKDTREAQTVEGNNIRLYVNKRLPDNIKVNDANIVRQDVKARNGVLQAIDKVLIPDS